MSNLSPEQIETLRNLKLLAKALGLDKSLIIVGATARLLQLDWPCKLRAPRTTEDVDFMLQVADWNQHCMLMNLATRSEFEADPKVEHRIRHRATDTIIDIVPFGGLEDPKGTITWPSSQYAMSVHGMSESEETAEVCTLADGLDFRVVSLPCFVALKLFAWDDRNTTARGANDLIDADFVLQNCTRLPRYENVGYTAYAALAESPNFSRRAGELDFIEHVGATVIGQELANILRTETKNRLRKILQPITNDPQASALNLFARYAQSAEENVNARQIRNTRYAIFEHYFKTT